MSSQFHLAFYLPQYHPIPENDEWWGAGFTDWTNVARARPRFRGHHQPHLPGDLGFYDLRLAETRLAQARLAERAGIDGFCYYHYWFGGRRLLERPFEEVLASGEPELPFCLAWANENWTRRWDGKSREILVAQDYSATLEHARWLARAFADPRYVRLDGRPVFAVYRVSDIPEPRKMTELWRSVARAEGVGEIYLLQIESFPNDRGDPRPRGFDAAVEFAPDWQLVPRRTVRELLDRVGQELPWRRRLGTHRIVSYAAMAHAMMAKPAPAYVRFPCVTPGWDNTPRIRRSALVFDGPTPAVYERWVSHATRNAARIKDGQSLVFVNAWNEWAEGAHLEPCRKWGHAFIEAHRRGRALADSADGR